MTDLVGVLYYSSGNSTPLASACRANSVYDTPRRAASSRNIFLVITCASTTSFPGAASASTASTLAPTTPDAVAGFGRELGGSSIGGGGGGARGRRGGSTAAEAEAAAAAAGVAAHAARIATQHAAIVVLRGAPAADPRPRPRAGGDAWAGMARG